MDNDIEEYYVVTVLKASVKKEAYIVQFDDGEIKTMKEKEVLETLLPFSVIDIVLP